MRFTRSRYVTICQQFLVTAVVLAVGLSAAGIMTLQIVVPEERGPQASSLAPAITVSDAYVDTAPVTPKVREVKVDGVEAAAGREIPGVVTSAPDPAAAPLKLAAVSAPTQVHGYATVGVTWKAGTKLAEDQIAVQVRTRTGDTWSDWTTAAYHDDHGPDPDSPEEQKVRPGTDAVVVGDVDEVQMRAETDSGQAPADLELAVVDPGTGAMTKQPAAIDTSKLGSDAGSGDTSPGARSTTSTGGDAAALMAMNVSPKPTIYSRAQWGANEALRDKSSLHYGTIQTGFIHHTVNANDYTPEQVPALIRGIYAYHTQSRGWSDIGYNFLVDRFGRIWEGRYGGVDRPVVGAHTKGYNEVSFAMSAIGNFDIAKPPKAVKQAFMQLFAWKLSMYDIRADASHLWVKNRFLYAINGHRDVGKTACPGRYLYAKLPKIRAGAQAIQDGAQVPTDPASLPVLPPPSGVPDPAQAPAPAAPQPSTAMPARSSLTGSGWPDVVGMTSAGTIQIATTEGILGFAQPVLSSGPWAKMSKIAAVGDVTGDGKGDVLARKKSSPVTKVYPGDGAGHFARKGIAPTKALKRYDLVIGAGDFDRDGRNDVIARNKKSTALVLLRGAGGGRFRDPVVLKKHWRYQLTVAAGRFDHGKKPDLLAMKPGGALSLFPGLGKDRKLGKRVPMPALPADTVGLYGGGDLTGDKAADLVVRRANGVSTIYAGTRSAALGQAYGSYLDLAGLTQATSGQALGGGAPEVVGRDAAGNLAAVAGNGLRNVSSVITTNLTVPGTSQVLDVGDWDRNGIPDLVTRDSGDDRLVLRPGLGDGRFGQGLSLGTGWSKVGKLAAVGDVTGDGMPDLVGRVKSTDAWTIYPGNGANGFKPPVLAGTALRTFNQIGTGAFSGTLFSSADRSFVPLTSGDAASLVAAANGDATASYDYFIGAGDVNGDQVADLLARETGTGTLWLLPGKTSGGFAPRVWVAAGFGGYQLLG